MFVKTKLSSLRAIGENNADFWYIRFVNYAFLLPNENVKRFRFSALFCECQRISLARSLSLIIAISRQVFGLDNANAFTMFRLFNGMEMVRIDASLTSLSERFNLFIDLLTHFSIGDSIWFVRQQREHIHTKSSNNNEFCCIFDAFELDNVACK